MSLPTRERELKLGVSGGDTDSRMSLPTRERELKQHPHHHADPRQQVAPHAGA